MTMAAKMMEASTYDGPFVNILRSVFCAGILRWAREELLVSYPLRLKSSGFSIFNSAILKLWSTFFERKASRLNQPILDILIFLDSTTFWIFGSKVRFTRLVLWFVPAGFLIRTRGTILVTNFNLNHSNIISSWNPLPRPRRGLNPRSLTLTWNQIYFSVCLLVTCIVPLVDMVWCDTDDRERYNTHNSKSRYKKWSLV